ncbi:MAG: universal stress protein [Verrucomicrobia bacterium]|nr:universal stress protein [Verrucomicrobiota bacterium]
MKTILTPVDFSGATPAVVAQAAGLAKALSAQVLLFNVVQPPVVIAEYGALLENIAEITEVGEKAATKKLAKLKQQLDEEGIPAQVACTVGTPVTVIIKQATDVKADYIVMGSHGHTAFFDLLVGSTTHGVLRRAACPVIVVPQAITHPKQKKKV